MDHELRQESAVEYFKSLLEDVLPSHRLFPRQETVFYICRILSMRVAPHQSILNYDSLNQPLALQLKSAQECETVLEKRHRLRILADESLFIAGFFPYSRRNIDVDYFIAIGRHAYGELSLRGEDVFANVFEELAQFFLPYTDALEEVSTRTSVARDSSILQLYDRWMRTGSRRTEMQLKARGIVPNHSLLQKSRRH